MKKLLLLPLSLLLLGGGAQAQQQQPATLHYHGAEPCLYNHAIEQTAQTHPYYRQAVEEAFRTAQRAGEAERGSRNTLVIPVVVHVVWRQTAENLPLATIQEQIDILNEDYQRLNPDTSRLRSVFQPIAANPQIQFRLDSVIYRQTDSVFTSSGLFPDLNVTNKVKRDCNGGDDAWDVTRYLNIWVCNLGSSGVLGFAYPPADLSNWPAGSAAPSLGLEGVVLDYRIVGRSGSISLNGTTITTQGRSATHEVGHYLGLRHIWGDGPLAVFGINDCSGNDGVNDTPTAGRGSNFQCDTMQNTCGAGTLGDLPDMIENYMDYSTESCMNSFTQGQVDIMRGVLSSTGYRYPLTLNSTYQPAPANDKAAAATLASVNTDNSCTIVAQGTTQHAHPSYHINQCSGNDYTGADVWFEFTAPNSEVTIDLLNVSAAQGSSTAMVAELLNGECANSQGQAQLRACISTFPHTQSSLTVGNTYFLRLYSANAADRQNFSLCLKSNGTEVGVERTLALDWAIFPNPNAGRFTLQVPADLPAASRLNIYNALGQNIATHLFNGDNAALQLDLSTQASGIYTAVITSADGRQSAQKIQIVR